MVSDAQLSSARTTPKRDVSQASAAPSATQETTALVSSARTQPHAPLALEESSETAAGSATETLTAEACDVQTLSAQEEPRESSEADLAAQNVKEFLTALQSIVLLFATPQLPE